MICIALFDIDAFKGINSKFGHLIGDEVLILIAYSVDKHVRDTDIFARWEGGKFVILLSDTTFEQALEIANRFKSVIAKLEHKRTSSVSASFGVTQVHSKDSLESVLSRAQEALDRAKAYGRNCVKGIE